MNAAGERRDASLDFLRALACFLVIVNHTNSLVFKASAPGDWNWWLSVLWYYGSKIAVPLFVMISGACLLPKRDTYKRAGLRLLRLIAVLVLFSYLYYLAGVLQTGGSWRAALGLKTFLASIWRGPITDSYWYLYFYAGLLLMLPLLQRLAQAMSRRDLRYMMALSFGVGALWPLLAHYAPALALPEFLSLPLFTGMLGLFFAGHYLRACAKPCRASVCWAAIALSLALSALLTAVEYGRVEPGAKYWFMDDRTAPALPTIVCACAVMALARLRLDERPVSERARTGWRGLGACAFGVYLVQDMVIAQTRYRLFVPLSGAIPPFLAALAWELVVFAVSLAAAWLLRLVPGLKKLL